MGFCQEIAVIDYCFMVVVVIVLILGLILRAVAVQATYRLNR